MHRRFVLIRQVDVSGVSGTGKIAEGVEFADGTVAIRWLGDTPSTVVWQSLDHAMRVHGHNGATEARMIDEEYAQPGRTHHARWPDGHGGHHHVPCPCRMGRDHDTSPSYAARQGGDN